MQDYLGCKVAVFQGITMGNAQSCVICCDGAPDDLLGRWGIGLTMSLHADRMGLHEPAIHSCEDSLNGWNRDSKYTDEDGKIQRIIQIPNDIATIETIAFARAFYWIATSVRPTIAAIVVTDRIASLRDLEHENGHPINTRPSSTRRRYRYAFAYSLRLLRTEIVRALRVHDTIRVFYYEARGFNSNWRADQLSRSVDIDDCRLPEANDDPFGCGLTSTPIPVRCV